MRQTLSLRIYQDLYNRIRSHFYKPGTQLPTESALAASYGASLSPVRQALGRLEQEQLIRRIPGKGTFVARSMPWENMLLMSGFGAQFIDRRVDEASVRCPTLLCERRTMTAEQEALFHAPAGREYTFLSRVRYVDGQPLFFLNHYFAAPGPETVRAAGEIKSLRAFLAGYGVRPAYVTERVKAAAADRELGNLFVVPFGFPLLKIIRKELDADYEPIIYSEYFVNSDVWDYRVQYHADDI